MLTDIEIAQSNRMKPIRDIAADLGIPFDDIELYGSYKAKLPLSLVKGWSRNRTESSYLLQP